MASPTVADVSGGAASGTSRTVTISASAGDLVIVMVAERDDYGQTWTHDQGFVGLWDDYWSYSLRLKAGYRRWESGDDTSLVVSTSGSVSCAWLVYVISAGTFDAAVPPEKWSAVRWSGTPDPDSITPSWGSADDLFIAAAAGTATSGGGEINGWPSGYTHDQSDGAGGPRLLAGSRAVSAATSEDAGAFGSNGVNPHCVGIIAIKGASAITRLPRPILRASQAVSRAATW